jgi:methylglutaconyl-CoA hydratase
VADAGSLRSSLADGVLTLTLDRPDKRNALDGALIEALGSALERADHDAAVRVVALRGAGRDFCAGADLNELLASADRSAEQNERDALSLGAVFRRMRGLARPVVAVVQGRALAGGAGLATAADIVVAADDAQLGYPEIQRGFVPAMVLTMLRRLVGERVAFDLVSTGRLLDASEARALGLVSRVVPAPDLEAAASALLGGLAAAPPSALTLTKRLLYELDGRSFDDGIALGARVNAIARATPEFRESIAQFLAR